MKKLTTVLALASLFTAGLVSCQKDDTDVTIISPLAGDFVGKETCKPAPAGSQYTVHVYNTAENKDKIYIDNIYDIGNQFEANVSGNTITLPSKPYEYIIPRGQPGAGTYTGNISGEGSVDGSILTFTFRADGDLADTCTFKGDRAYRYPAEGN